jgi:hypothetical protein
VIPQEKNSCPQSSRSFLGTAITAVSIASPALAQYASEKGRLTSVRHSGHVRTTSHRSALRAFASIPRIVDDPAGTGGGSIGYNENLRLNHW